MIVVNTFALALAQCKIVGIFITSLIGMMSMEVSGIVESCTANTCVFVLIVVTCSSFIPNARHNVLLNSLPVIDRIRKFIEDFKTRRKWFTDMIVIM